jgi:hypothetical protein
MASLGPFYRPDKTDASIPRGDNPLDAMTERTENGRSLGFSSGFPPFP